MVEIIWEYIVRDQSRGQFELTFGPGGAWSRIFTGAPGFRGITLLRDLEDMGRYLAIELWNSEIDRDNSISEDNLDYMDLITNLDTWTESKAQVGTFRVLAEATIRPKAKSGRRKM